MKIFELLHLLTVKTEKKPNYFFLLAQEFQICQRHSDVESYVEELTQFKELHELNDIDLIDESEFCNT